MRFQNRKLQAWLRFFASFLLCVLFCGLIFGTTYARYENSLSEPFTLQYEGQSGQIYIRSVQNNETAADEELQKENVEDVYEIDFILSNGADSKKYCTYDQTVTLSLFATVGLGDPEKFIITIVDGNTTYLAKCSEVVKGNDLYTTYGPGWMYHFYDTMGNEVQWQFPGTLFIERQMKLIIVGASEMPASMNLIAGVQPSTQ